MSAPCPDEPAPPEAARAALARASAVLREAGIDNPRLEARLLLAHALGVSQEALIADPDRAAPAAFGALVARRAAREPLAYIIGRQEFWSLPFAVSPATLIPRADSETLVSAALEACPDGKRTLRVLDLGTGTGCLLLAVLSERPGAWGVGVDLAPAAAALAARNSGTLGLAGRAAFLAGNWDTALGDARFDLILANPPYIPSADIPGLMADVADHEPGTALDGGPDGLDAYRRVIAACRRLLAPEGVAVLELGIGQDVAVAALALAAGFTAATRPDLAGIARALVLRPSATQGTRPKKSFGSKREAD